MSFLDKLKETAGVAAQAASSVANTAVSKTKTMAAAGRVKLAISQEEDKLKKAYTELGRLYYRDYTAGTEADQQEYLPWCSRAEEAKAEIQRLTEELEAIKAADAVKEPEEAEMTETAENTAESASEPVDEPQVGTLYVDTTGEDQ